MLKIASSVTPPVQARNTLSIFESSIFIPYRTGKNQRCSRLFFSGLVVKSAMRKIIRIIRMGIVLIVCHTGLAEAGEAVLASGAVVDEDSVFCQAFGFAVVRTRPDTG